MDIVLRLHTLKLPAGYASEFWHLRPDLYNISQRKSFEAPYKVIHGNDSVYLLI